MSESLKELQNRVDAYAETLEVHPSLSTQEVTIHDLELLPSLDWPSDTSLINSVDEFLLVCWGLEALSFVHEAYRIILHREVDESGLANYLRQLDAGVARIEIILALLNSSEAQKKGVHSLVLGSWPTWWRWLCRLKKVGLGSGIQSKLYLYQEQLMRRALMDQKRFMLASMVKNAINPWRRPLDRLGANQRTQIVEMRALQQQLSQLQHAHRELLAQLQGFKLLHHAAPSLESQTSLAGPVSDPRLEAYYLAFEEANRGSEEAIARKMQVYESWAVKQKPLSSYPILDLGCGRGEWLQWLKNKNLIACGVDSNPLMVARCQEQGLSVVQSDLLTYLNAQSDQTLGGVSAFQVIEHLPFEVLFDLVSVAWQKLVSGGSILLETPNPENLLVATHTFYHDFTHRHPVTPTALSFLLRYHGFVELEVVRSHPYPPSARVPGQDPLTERVNGHLCGPQDYAVIAYKP